MALEKMAQDPVLEMEVGPPVCPHCQKFNPSVRSHEGEEEGPLFEFVAQFLCLECGKVFYGLPVQWSLHQDTLTLKIEMQGRSDLAATNQR